MNSMFIRYRAKNITFKVSLATLPHSTGKGFFDGFLKTTMIIRYNVFNST
ncbi:hypothetical protein N184_37795 [Sinorhizobium sp. GL28]|nr:hypothetical protein N184_37795 [Sinorhizobium sp. GL28]